MIQTESKSKIIETKSFTANLRDDNIVHVHIKSNTSITVGLQAKMQIAYWKLTDEPIPFIFTAGQFLTITKEARENAIKMEKDVPVSASALIILNTAQRILANFYYKVNKPKNPLKIFNEFDDGIKWLLENT